MYKKLLFDLYKATEWRPWKTEKCYCSRNPCYSSAIVPECPDHKNDYIVAGGDMNTNDAEFLVLAHNMLPNWVEGEDTPRQWAELRELDQKVGPPVKWRYQHCFAVRRKKYRQTSCWCREIVAVGISGSKRCVIDAARISKHEAMLMTFMHNHLLEN
jgi:hypothetical protein